MERDPALEDFYSPILTRAEWERFTSHWRMHGCSNSTEDREILIDFLGTVLGHLATRCTKLTNEQTQMKTQLNAIQQRLSTLELENALERRNHVQIHSAFRNYSL